MRYAFLGILLSAFLSAALVSSPKVKASEQIYDYLVMNVCVDPVGRVTDMDPLACPLAAQRDVRPGDSLAYIHADFQTPSRAQSCGDVGESRRYAFPLSTPARDETGASYPLIVGWTDYPPRDQPCDGFGQFDARDTATLLTVNGPFASLVGAFHHKHWYLTLGHGYREPGRVGVSRFLGTWSFPTDVPPLGSTGWSRFERKTRSFSDGQFDARTFPANDPNTNLATTIQFWKHMTFAFGARDHASKTMETILHIPFTQVAQSGDAPGDSRGSEHLYLTRELGYVSRWESWARDDNDKDVMGLAQKAYNQQACSKPGTIEGKITPNLEIGPIIDDADQHVFKQLIVTETSVDRREEHSWYMTGCHDFTNVRRVPSYQPSNLINEATFGAPFIAQFTGSSTAAIPSKEDAPQ